MSRFVLIPLFFALHVSAATQTALSLGDSIKKGLSYSLEYQKAESSKRQADAEFRLARSSVLPTLDINASDYGTENTERSGGAWTRAYKARLDVSQPLFTGGALTSALKAAKLKREIAEQNLRSVRQEYIYKVVDAYYKAAQAQVVLELSKENRAALKAYFEITTKYAAIGRSKGIDRLQAESNYNLSESQVLDAESALETARNELSRLLGDEQGLQSELDAKLKLEAYDPGAADKLLHQALENNPDIQLLQLTVDELAYENRAKMIAYRPSLSLKGSWGYDASRSEQWFTEPSETYSVGLVLKIPLFAGLGSVALSDQLSEQRVQAEKNLQIKRAELRKTLTNALATMQRDFNRLKLTQVSATVSKKAMDVAVRDYRNGLLSSTDVISIQRTRFEADRQYLLAQYSYNQQMLNLRRDLGVDLVQIYQGK